MEQDFKDDNDETATIKGGNSGVFSTEDLNSRIHQDLEQTTEAVSAVDGEVLADTDPDKKSASWKTASNLVKRFRPIPWAFWTAIRGVYRKPEEIGIPGGMSFDVCDSILKAAIKDEIIGRNLPSQDVNNPYITVNRMLELMGNDVAASLCFIYAICRRVGSHLAERVWKPIIDDALLRAQIGYLVGAGNPTFGRGRGMLAGFSGRSGLAIQIASGSHEQASNALESLALGLSTHAVGMAVYGCGPLQVSAMALAAAGISQDAAFGTASYAVQDTSVKPGSSQYKWFAAFSIIEKLRMGQSDKICDELWQELGYDKQIKLNALKKSSQQFLRSGHSWYWLLRTSGLGDGDDI